MQNLHPALQILAVYLADTKFGRSGRDSDITEMWNLVLSLGAADIMDLVEQKGYPHPATFIGPGKAEEITEYLRSTHIDVVLVYGNLTSNQKFTLTKRFWDINPQIKVWDRIDLILAIFSRHAHTQEAKLQIELARMRHMGPAIFGMGMVLSRQGAGIGTRGIGETNTERMKRHWRREMKRVTDALGKLEDSSRRQIENRKTRGLPTVSLVGYTNAGKSTLFNALTRKKTYVNNLLFATLDSTVGTVYLEPLKSSVVVSDTIGFIRDLPPDLIDAFKSTLLESTMADVVLHVVDASDPELYRKIEVVDDILDQLLIPEEKILLVFNKIDAAPAFDPKEAGRRFPGYPLVTLSAASGKNIDGLVAAIGEKLR